MRKQAFLFIIIASCVYISCNSGGMSGTAKKNLEVNQAIMKAYEAGDFSKMGDYIATDAVDHAGESGDIKGLENIIAEMKRYKSMMKDTRTEIIREMADNEYVITWAKFSGTLTADGMGMKAGDKMNTSSVDVAKFKDGKATEHWTFMDSAEMMKMMSSMQPAAPAQEMKKDSVKAN
jgi:predicted ester cyclase